MIESAVRLFPEPLSPTRPRGSLRSTAKETPSSDAAAAATGLERDRQVVHPEEASPASLIGGSWGRGGRAGRRRRG